MIIAKRRQSFGLFSSICCWYLWQFLQKDLAWCSLLSVVLDLCVSGRGESVRCNACFGVRGRVRFHGEACNWKQKAFIAGRGCLCLCIFFCLRFLGGRKEFSLGIWLLRVEFLTIWGLLLMCQYQNACVWSVWSLYICVFALFFRAAGSWGWVM